MAEIVNDMAGPALIKPDALANRSSSLPTMFAPRSFADLQWFSKVVAESDFAPKGYQGKPGNVFIAIQMGAEVGLGAMAALQNIAVINGRPSIWGDAALGIVQVHPHYEWHKEWLEGAGDNRVGVFQVKRKGHDMHEQRFCVQDAKTANLWTKDGPWKTYPERMLKMRARGFALRDKFADALRGLIIAEEAQDYPVIDIQSSAVPELMAADPEGPRITEAEQAARVKAERLLRDELHFTHAKIAATLGKYDGSTPELMPSKLVEKISLELAGRMPKPENGNGQAPTPAEAKPHFDPNQGVEQFIPPAPRAPVPAVGTGSVTSPEPAAVRANPEPVKADKSSRKGWEAMF